MSYREVEYIKERTNPGAMRCDFEQLRQNFNQTPYTNYQDRLSLLSEIKQRILLFQDQLGQALNEDFTCRSEFDSYVSDLIPTMEHIHYTIRHLKKWMADEPRWPGLLLAPSRLHIRYQPLGVVGIMSPWNFPMMLPLVPAITALAAGNRVMIKLSEFTPATNTVLREILNPFTSHISLIEGEQEVASRFSQLPFDHLLFTGSTQVGKKVAQAAAVNLTPVTLELGGKSPVIIQPGADIKRAAENIFFGKWLNSGQICVSPDHLYLPAGSIASFVKHYKSLYQSFLETHTAEQQTRIINQHHYQRLQSMLQDARDKGAVIHTLTDQILLPQQIHHILLEGVDDSMQIMQEEIFGPLLPMIEYREIDWVVQKINLNERPLALYIMGEDTELTEHILRVTHSGGVCINDAVLHVGATDAPFGGIGQSGIGHYHGPEGFKRFSHARTTLTSHQGFPKKVIVLRYQNLVLKLTRWLYMR